MLIAALVALYLMGMVPMFFATWPNPDDEWIPFALAVFWPFAVILGAFLMAWDLLRGARA